MYFLLIDTSGDDSFVALCSGRKVLLSQVFPPNEQSKLLAAVIQDLLKKSGLSLKELGFIAIGKGPGSFTGTRVGVMMAKTLSFAKQIPLVPFCSLKRFIPVSNGSFMTIIDAKSNGLYVLEGEKQGSQVRFLGAPKLLNESELTPLIQTKLSILSPHIERIQKRFPSLSPDLTWFQASPDLTFLAQLVSDRYYIGKKTLHSGIEVSYLHDPI